MSEHIAAAKEGSTAPDAHLSQADIGDCLD
jgi:hypothetical protein